MELKKNKKFQMVGFIEEADTERVSIVEHGANQIPFSVLKNEGNVEWVSLEKQEEEMVNLSNLVNNVKLVSIRFPFGTSDAQAKAYMSKFEDDTYSIDKDMNNIYTATTKSSHNNEEIKEVILPSGVIYTLSKSDTMKTGKKENGNMSKKSEKTNKETEKKEAPVEAVETEVVPSEAIEATDTAAIAEEVVEEVAKTEETITEETAEAEDSLESLKEDLVAALKALPAEDVTAILEQLSQPSETTKAETTESEAEDTDEAQAEEVQKEEATEAETAETAIAEEVDTHESSVQEEIECLKEETANLIEQNKEFSQAIEALTEQVKSLVATNEELSNKVEKSLSEDEAIEVIKELSARVESLEYAPASSETSHVEKSEEVSNGKEATHSFLSKYL